MRERFGYLSFRHCITSAQVVPKFIEVQQIKHPSTFVGKNNLYCFEKHFQLTPKCSLVPRPRRGSGDVWLSPGALLTIALWENIPITIVNIICGCNTRNP